jgi:multidrug efflux system outer membrane protein
VHARGWNAEPAGRAARVWPAAALLACLAACAPPLDDSRPRFAFAPAWSGAAAGAPRLMDTGAWWQGYEDPVLDALLAQALAGNPTLAAARARAEAAEAAARAVPGALTAEIAAEAEAAGGPEATVAETRQARLVGTVALIFDPGRSRAAERMGVRAEAARAGAAAAGARLFVIAEVTEAYLAYRGAQTRLALAGAEAARQRQTVALAERLAAGGQAIRVETLRARARAAEVAAEIPGLEAEVAGGRARLAVLAGAAPGGLPPALEAGLAGHRPVPRARLAPDPGVPADLLRNRPDIALAEAAYDAARASLGGARAALYPRLSLSGTIEARRSDGPLDGTVEAQLGPALRLPAFPPGPARAGVAGRAAEVAAAHAEWRGAVLAALAEVEAALADYRAAAAAEAAAARARSLYAEAAGLSRALAEAGEATLGDLLDAEEAVARADRTLAAARLARALAYARLNLRLGGAGRG